MAEKGRNLVGGVLRRASVVLSLVLAVGLVPLSWTGVDGEVGPEHDWSMDVGFGGEGGKWVHLSSTDGIKTAYLQQKGSRTIGLKGSAVVNHHIAPILNVFLNSTRSREWVSFLGTIEEYPTQRINQHIIYQHYSMPWPLGDRDFVLERTVDVDKRARTVAAHYKSINHPMKPVSRGVVRGEAHSTFWKFRSLGAGRTEIHVESQLDPKLSVSPRLVTLMQSAYQRSSLMQLLSLVERALPHPEFAHW